MNRDAIVRLLLELGVDRDHIRERRAWINCHCPLAPYTHASGEDKHPSFGISINDDGPSVYYCFGCSPVGKHLGWLLHTFFVASGSYPFEAAKVYRENEIFNADDVVHVPDVWEAELPEYPRLPLSVLNSFPLLQSGKDYEARRCRHFLEVERGIPVWVQNLCRLRYSPEHSAIIFPMTDVSGEVYVLRARLRKEKRMWTVSPEWTGAKGVTFPSLHNVGVWFGSHLVDWSRPVMLVEGEIDAMKIMSFGFFNVVASATSSVSERQLDAICTDVIILGYDSDASGRKTHKRISNYFGGKATLFEAKWDMIENKKKGGMCKDAGDLSSGEDFAKVLNALTLL